MRFLCCVRAHACMCVVDTVYCLLIFFPIFFLSLLESYQIFSRHMAAELETTFPSLLYNYGRPQTKFWPMECQQKEYIEGPGIACPLLPYSPSYGLGCDLGHHQSSLTLQMRAIPKGMVRQGRLSASLGYLLEQIFLTPLGGYELKLLFTRKSSILFRSKLLVS